MKLQPLSINDMPTLLKWRNESMEILRTPYMLTNEQQNKWYNEVICDRKSTVRYWKISLKNTLIGYGGIENIEWENRRGEISILIGPKFRRKGYGTEAAGLFLNQAFNFLNLDRIWGECYFCGNIKFWQRLAKIHNAYCIVLPDRKFWNGKYHNSLYITFKASND